jgi:hypothetical protein
MNDLAEDLRRWADSVAPVTEAEAIARASARRRRRSHHRPRPATLTAAAAVVTAAAVVVAGIVIATAARTAGPTLRTGSPADPADPGTTVSVAVDGLGPLAITTGPLHAPEPGSTAWAQHDLRFENTGTTPVILDDTRRSAFPHGEPLVLAEEGCAFQAEVGVECLDDDRSHYLAPGESFTLAVSVWRDQPGVPPFHAGTYTFAKQLTYVPGSPTAPLATGTITITYTIGDAAVPGTAPGSPSSTK